MLNITAVPQNEEPGRHKLTIYQWIPVWSE